MFCAYHNAGLWAFCSPQEPTPTKLVYSSLAQNFASGRGASFGMRAVRLLGNLACSLSWLSLTIPCWISTFPVQAAGSWAIKSSFNLTRKAGPGGEGAGLHPFLALMMQWLPVRDVGAPCELIPAWVLCLLCLFVFKSFALLWIWVFSSLSQTSWVRYQREQVFLGREV